MDWIMDQEKIFGYKKLLEQLAKFEYGLYIKQPNYINVNFLTSIIVLW